MEKDAAGTWRPIQKLDEFPQRAGDELIRYIFYHGDTENTKIFYHGDTETRRSQRGTESFFIHIF